MRIGRNLVAGLGGSVLTALVSLAVIPFYLRYLGAEGYGLVGFLATMQAVVQILDLGLALTVNREIARATESGDMPQGRTLLHTLACVYWAVAGLIAATIALLSPFVAVHWLRADSQGDHDVRFAVLLIALVIACRWPGQLYQGALMGAQRIATSSALTVTWVAIGSGGAVFILAFVSPSVEAMFMWQAIVGLAYVLAARAASWRVLGRQPVRYDTRQVVRIWRFSAGLTGAIVTGIAIGQLDKVVMSKVLKLSSYGEYMLAVAVAGSLYLVSTPFFNALYPRFSALVRAADGVRLTDTYRVSTRLLAGIVFPLAMLFCVFPGEIVQAWTGNLALARGVSVILPILVVGNALNGVMHIPYALQLANGMTRMPLTINVVVLLVALPLTIVLASAFGAVGGAAAWLFVHILCALFGTWLTHRDLLKGLGPRWLALDVGVPLSVSVAVGFLAKYSPIGRGLDVFWRLGIGLSWMAFAVAITIAISPGLRSVVLHNAREWVLGKNRGTT